MLVEVPRRPEVLPTAEEVIAKLKRMTGAHFFVMRVSPMISGRTATLSLEPGVGLPLQRQDEQDSQDTQPGSALRRGRLSRLQRIHKRRAESGRAFVPPRGNTLSGQTTDTVAGTAKKRPQKSVTFPRFFRCCEGRRLAAAGRSGRIWVIEARDPSVP
jgi:hypothetical protein